MVSLMMHEAGEEKQMGLWLSVFIIYRIVFTCIVLFLIVVMVTRAHVWQFSRFPAVTGIQLSVTVGGPILHFFFVKFVGIY